MVMRYHAIADCLPVTRALLSTASTYYRTTTASKIYWPVLH